MSDESGPTLSVVVLSWNTRELTLTCLGSLFAETPAHPREIIVVDNASSDGSADAIADRFPQVQLLRHPVNSGYAEGNNIGARAAAGRFLCLLNSDTEVRPGALDRAVDWLIQHPGYGACAPKLVNPDGTVQRACMRFPGILTALCFDTVFGRIWPGTRVDASYFMRDFDHLESRDVDQPPGACFLMARKEYLAMGGLDAGLFLFFNDVDLCLRLWKQGRRIRYLADAEVVHHGGASTRSFARFVVLWHKNRLSYYRKHHGRLVVAFVRAMVRWRALEEWFRLRARHPKPAELRDARAHLRSAVKEILAR